MKSLLIGFFIYFSLAVAILQNWLWLAAGLVLFFSFRHGAGALIPLFVMVDGYFGNFNNVPLLSLLGIIWYLLVVYFRPKIVNLRIMESYESSAG